MTQKPQMTTDELTEHERHMWFDLHGDKRLGRCATEGCGGQPTFRLESGGIGSDYCSGCRARIDRLKRRLDEVKSRAGTHGQFPPTPSE